jgi:hypothetical protein
VGGLPERPPRVWRRQASFSAFFKDRMPNAGRPWLPCPPSSPNVDPRHRYVTWPPLQGWYAASAGLRLSGVGQRDPSPQCAIVLNPRSLKLKLGSIGQSPATHPGRDRQQHTCARLPALLGASGPPSSGGECRPTFESTSAGCALDRDAQGRSALTRVMARFTAPRASTEATAE